MRRNTVLGLAIATMLAITGFSTGTATADPIGTLGSDATVFTTDGQPGGRGAFRANGDVLEACDLQSDGWGAIAKLYRSGASSPFRTVTSGGAGCITKTGDIAEGTALQVAVCLVRGNEQAFCSPRAAAVA
jgi:hypothetical protein